MITNHEILQTIQKFELTFGADQTPPGIRALLEASAAPTNRATLPGHITCSALVLNPKDLVLMVHHITFNRWLFPGGHVEDTDEDLLAAAKREAVEETGINPDGLQNSPWLPTGTPIDIDGHMIPANPNKGEQKHIHYDFRFLLRAPDGPLYHQAQEVHAAYWRSLEHCPEKIRLRIATLKN